MIIADTSGLGAFFNRREAASPRVVRFMESVRDVVVSPYVLAELDYLVTQRAGVRGELEMLRRLTAESYILPEFGTGDLLTAIEVIERYRDQAIGVTDASLVVLADRYGTRDILTLDYRHFDVLRPLDGGRFRLMPRDWEGSDA